MKDKELVLELMKKNNGVIEAEKAVELGVDNKILQRLHRSGDIERVEHGIYIDPDFIEDEYLITQYRCKKGVYSHETALFFHDLTDRTPVRLMLTIPSGYNTRLLKEKSKYKFFYINKKQHEIGQAYLLSPYGNKISVYNKERTICDCIRKKEQLDTNLVTTAIKRYMKDSDADFARLLEYAEIFKVRTLVKQYMEVLS